mmetsp:Transcript_19034/g.24503  ORF Transcript_19034/g.24503 Transcript_19034/m.24503 type:complete len:197 (-) Transcript_19034:125-715(-)
MAFKQINLIIVAFFCILGCTQVAAEGSIAISFPWATDIGENEDCSEKEDKIIRDIVESVAILGGYSEAKNADKWVDMSIKKNGKKANNGHGHGQGRRYLRKVDGTPLTHRQLVAEANGLCEKSSIGCIDCLATVEEVKDNDRKLDVMEEIVKEVDQNTEFDQENAMRLLGCGGTCYIMCQSGSLQWCDCCPCCGGG